MAEKKYIELQKALNVCEMHYQHCLEMHYQHCLEMHDRSGDTTADNIMRDIETIPTADVVEVRHGEWKVKVHILTKAKTVSCSECGYSMSKGPAWDSFWGLPPYCQECGATMDGGKTE